MADVLCARERLIDGELVSIWGKEVITMVKKDTSKESVLIKSLDKYRM